MNVHNAPRWNVCLLSAGRDTAPLSSDTFYRRQIKNWAVPLCNDLLRKLNSNWINTGYGDASYQVNTAKSLETLVNAESEWNRIAYGIYGLITRQQNCGVNGSYTNCIYVLNSDLNAVSGSATQSQTQTFSQPQTVFVDDSLENNRINHIDSPDDMSTFHMPPPFPAQWATGDHKIFTGLWLDTVSSMKTSSLLDSCKWTSQSKWKTIIQ